MKNKIRFFLKRIILWVMKNDDFLFAQKGENVVIGRNPTINSPKMIRFGNNVLIGPYVVLYSIYKSIIFKNNIILGPHVTMVSGDHSIRKIGVTIVGNHEKYPEDDADIVVEDDVWIGANVTVLKGVTIGRGCVVAAGAVVVKSILPYCVVGGVPARVIGKRFSINQVLEHEQLLYPLEERLNEIQLIHLNNI